MRQWMRDHYVGRGEFLALHRGCDESHPFLPQIKEEALP